MTSDRAVPLLVIRDLEVRFGERGHETTVLDGVSIDIFAGEVFGLIGETGAGKSLTAWAALDLLPVGARLVKGDVQFADKRLTGASSRELREIRGAEIGVVVQNPLGALDPTRRIGDQLADVIRSHRAVARRDAANLAAESLRAVGIGDPKRRLRAYPHELSGGMAQRVLIAMALVNGPRLVIADEPTTGLDVTVQAEILDLMTRRVHETGAAIWIITHDLGVIANYTERAGVMFAGEVVELASTADLFHRPRHPYTIGLLDIQSDRLDAAVSEAGRLPPDLSRRPPGCQFQYRCPWVEDACRRARPQLEELQPGHRVRCFVAARLEVEARPVGARAAHG